MNKNKSSTISVDEKKKMPFNVFRKGLTAGALGLTMLLSGAGMLVGCGEPGIKGDTGATGKSAYDLAVENGFTGTVQEWLDSLKGQPGGTGSEGNGIVSIEKTGSAGLTDTYTITFTDGTTTTFNITNGEDGTSGAPGTPGTSSYTHIKYSATMPNESSDMTDTPSAYIGIYTGISELAPTDYTAYTWHKIKGEDGENGSDGIDGAHITNQVSAWKGKTAVFVGDSITYGSKCEGDKYWEVLEEKLGFEEVTGMGVGKSCISAKSTNGTSYEPLISRYNDIPEADLIQIFMGTNDYGFNTPLGTITDATDISFYGALNVIIPALQTKFPSSRIVFVTPLHRYGQHDLTYDYNKNTAGHSLEDYVKAIKETCQKYSVPVIDLYNVSGINPSLEVVRDLYMPDGLHPNTEGHDLIANIMANYLEMYAISDLNYIDGSEIRTLEQISLSIASLYYPSSTADCRLSSNYNVYLKKGQTLLFKDGVNFKYFLYPQTNSTPTQVTDEDRMSLMSAWATDYYVVAKSGWYGITMAKSDMTAFDETTISTETLADYFLIVNDEVKSLEDISVERTSPYYPSSEETCRLSSVYNVYLEAGQSLTLKESSNYKYFLYKQSSSIPTPVTDEDRMSLMSAWATETYTATISGWYGITMAKADMSEFDESVISNQSLADYFTLV